MCLVKNNQERLFGILLKPLFRAVENGSLNRPHEHVFEHRIVRHEKIRRRSLHFMPRNQLNVIRQHDSATESLSPSILPFASLVAEPSNQIGLGRPLASLLELS